MEPPINACGGRRSGLQLQVTCISKYIYGLCFKTIITAVDMIRFLVNKLGCKAKCSPCHDSLKLPQYFTMAVPQPATPAAMSHLTGMTTISTCSAAESSDDLYVPLSQKEALGQGCLNITNTVTRHVTFVLFKSYI